VLLIVGRTLIAKKLVTWHRRVMISAVTTSTLFLISYLLYHSQVGSVRFQGQGWVRPLYFGILLTHTILAIVIVPLVLVTLARGLRGNFDRHRAIARWTYPVWLYVSVTGVVIYVMLYHLYRAP
jgi:putative membrane protein